MLYYVQLNNKNTNNKYTDININNNVDSINNVQLSKIEVNDKFNLDKANFEVVSVRNNTNNSANESS